MDSSLVLQKLIPKLVTNLTGFKPNNENYKICVDYSWSQFKHHRFLSLNTHEVKRDIEGICQKFKFNHFHDEEKIIRKLFEQSLSHEISINHNQRDVMYSIMNFLISLAYDPINKLKDKKRRGLPIFIKPQANEVEENILTARKHFIDSLLQDNFFVSKNDTDSDLSEWTESEDEERQKSTEESEVESKQSQIISTRLRPPQKPSVYEKVKLENTLKWLKENVQNCWWNVEEVINCDEVSSSHKAANFYTEWQRHLTRKSLGFIKPPPVSLLSEFCLLREILWMFLNPVNCKFFKLENGVISLRQNVCLPSTTIDTLHIFLAELVNPMNIMYRLKMSTRNALKNPALNHTLENYYGLIEKFLDQITEFFIKEEEIIKDEEGIYTIITLYDKIKPHSRMLNMLWSIHVSCMLDDEKYPSHIHALFLIANLHQQVHLSSSKEQKNLSLTFLLICLQTYLQIFDIWWTEARLHDSKLEFLVEKILVDDYELIQPRLIAKCKEKAFYISDKVSSKITEDSIVSTLSSYAVEASFTLEVISKLDRIHEIKQIGGNFKSLYAEFMELIYDEIRKLASNKEDIKEHPTINETAMSNNEKLISDIGSEMLAENDDIMYLIFNSTFKSLAIKEEKVEASPIEIYDLLNNATDSIFMPLDGSLERIMRKLLAKKIGIAERFVMDIYFNEFQVEHYLQEVRKVYFLESNELINLFNMTLFPQMERGEKWANSYLLTVLFNETISRDTTLFTVHVNKILGHQTVLEAIDELTIYLNVNNNHFDNIFTSSCINKYNEVFRFLLKIKWAQRILNSLVFPDFYKHRPPYAKFTMLDLVIKRLSITRFSMQHAITMIHNNIMVSLQSLSIQFEENVAKTNKITDLIIFHDKFVQNFHSKALLGNGSKRIRGIVSEMLKLAKVVTNEWHNIVTFYELDSTGQTIDDSISLTKLNINTIEIEKAFKICEKQLKDLLYY